MLNIGIEDAVQAPAALISFGFACPRPSLQTLVELLQSMERIAEEREKVRRPAATTGARRARKNWGEAQGEHGLRSAWRIPSSRRRASSVAWAVRSFNATAFARGIRSGGRSPSSQRRSPHAGSQHRLYPWTQGRRGARAQEPCVLLPQSRHSEARNPCPQPREARIGDSRSETTSDSRSETTSSHSLLLWDESRRISTGRISSRAIRFVPWRDESNRKSDHGKSRDAILVMRSL
jgi:hypothetical protein